MKRTLILILLTAAVLLAALTACGEKPLTAAELLDLGEKYLLELNYGQAVVQFLRLIEIEPMNPRGYTGAAEAYIGLGETDKAVAVLEKGLSVLPDNDDIQKMLESARKNPQKELPEISETDKKLLENVLAAAQHLDYENLYEYLLTENWNVLFDYITSITSHTNPPGPPETVYFNEYELFASFGQGAISGSQYTNLDISTLRIWKTNDNSATTFMEIMIRRPTLAKNELILDIRQINSTEKLNFIADKSDTKLFSGSYSLVRYDPYLYFAPRKENINTEEIFLWSYIGTLKDGLKDGEETETQIGKNGFEEIFIFEYSNGIVVNGVIDDNANGIEGATYRIVESNIQGRGRILDDYYKHGLWGDYTPEQVVE